MKYKQTGKIVEQTGSSFSYDWKADNDGHTYRIPKEIIENSNDWKLVQEIPEYVELLIDCYGYIKGDIAKVVKELNSISYYEVNVPSRVSSSKLKPNVGYKIVDVKPSTKETYLKQELKNSIKSMKHGEWYKITITFATQNWLFKFDKIVDETVFTFDYIDLDYKKVNPWKSKNLCNILNIKSLSPATQQEVEQYFPNEFKKPLFITEDKVDIFDGDNYWYINTTDSIMNPMCTAVKGKLYDHTNKSHYFSTKAKAQEYLDSLILNKAKEKYKIGNLVECDFVGNIYSGVINSELRWNTGNTSIVCNIENSNLNMLVYCKKPKECWAVILSKEETLLEKAKRLYVPGVIFKCPHFKREFKVLVNSVITQDNKDCIRIRPVSEESVACLYDYTVGNVRWAEIISQEENKPLFTKKQQEFIEQLINNKLKELQ